MFLKLFLFGIHDHLVNQVVHVLEATGQNHESALLVEERLYVRRLADVALNAVDPIDQVVILNVGSDERIRLSLPRKFLKR